jgi:hypothetical protein
MNDFVLWNQNQAWNRHKNAKLFLNKYFAGVGDVTADCGLCVGQASSGEDWIMLALLRLNMGLGPGRLEDPKSQAGRDLPA